MANKKIDITTLKKYTLLTILRENKEAHKYKKIKTKYVRYVDVLCDCGNIKTVSLRNLRSGNVKTCGSCNYFGKIRHKETNTSLYRRYSAIKLRCYNPQFAEYNHYGGRKITMCDEWKNDYTKFRDWALVNGYKPKLQIDRIDNNGNYEPSNCRWVTATKNNNNKSNNVFVKYKGKTKTLGEWSKIIKIKNCTLNRRIKMGWSVKKAFETPVASRYRQL